MRAYKGNRGMALLFLTLMLGEVEWSISSAGPLAPAKTIL